MNLDRRLLALARRQPGLLALTVFCGFSGGLFTLLQAGALSLIVERVFLGGGGLAQVQALLLLLLAVVVARAVLVWAGEQAAGRLALRLKRHVRLRLFDHLAQAGPAYTRAERTGELDNLLVDGVEALDAYYSQFLPQLFLAVLVPVTFLIVVFPLDPLSGLVLLLTGPLIPLFMALIGGVARRLTARQWQTLGRMSAYFLDVLQGLPTLKLFGRSRAQVQNIAQVSERYRRATMSVLRVTFLSALALELLATLSTAVVAVQVGVRLLYGHLPFVEAFFVLLLAPEFYAPLRALGARFHAGMGGVAAAQRIFAVLETPAGGGAPEPAASPAAPAAPAAPPAISFRGVSFTYPDGTLALQNFSLDLPPGQRLALVGASGAGKSTLAALLLRFIEPQSGEIRVDGARLDSLPPEAWRAQTAYVPQAPYLFAGTLADNLRLARPDAAQADLERAARLAGAHAFIQALPAGYQTRLGERGAGLSGGQAQRIALARAFLKDAPLVILDEATANLDPLVETEITAALERLLQGRTALVVAHRLGTVQKAGRIAVLEGGRLAEYGPPAELAARAGPYRRLLESSRPSSGLPPGDFPSAGQEAGPPPAPGTVAAEGPPSAAREPGPGPVQAPSSRQPASPPGPFATLLRLLGLIRPFAGWTALSVLLGALTVFSGVGLMGASAYIISAAALQPSIADLQIAIVGVRFFGLARGVFRYLERLVSHNVTFRLLARLRTGFYAALEPLAPAALQRYRSGDLLGRILGDIATLENFYVRGLAPPLVAVLVGAGTALFLFGYAPRLGWALAAFFLLGGLGVPLLARLLARRAGRTLIAARAALNETLVESLQGLPDLLAFNAVPRQRLRVETVNDRLQAAQRRLTGVNALQAALTGLTANLALWSVLALAVPLVAGGQIPGVYLAALVLVALSACEALLPLPVAAQHLESDLQAAQRLFGVAESPPEVVDPPGALPLPRSPAGPPALQVRDLSFAYPLDGNDLAPAGAAALTPAGLAARAAAAPFELPPGTGAPDLPQMEPQPPGPGAAAHPALDGLTFELSPGQRLAVVGPSGAGKSTLAALLVRFWDYRRGEILLDGRELRRYAQDDVRRQVALVSQSTYLFNVSVRENLQIANPRATREEIENAARAARIHDLILSLPQGYETPVGEFGQRLSGGERQRLALARALLKDAPLLILDEPTANLDPVTARLVLDDLLRLSAGRSLLLITHHLAGLEAMDEILVLDRGRVVERGAHAALLAQPGLYRRMWEVQREALLAGA